MSAFEAVMRSRSSAFLEVRDVLLGTGLCALLAAGACTLAVHINVKPFVPFAFLGVLLVIALRFGTLAGMMGTISAAVIFVLFLFEPLYRLSIHDAEAKANLGWMLAGGFALSTLFGRVSRYDASQKH
jgi:K+-sensing histidine kinase KdpD